MAEGEIFEQFADRFEALCQEYANALTEAGHRQPMMVRDWFISLGLVGMEDIGSTHDTTFLASASPPWSVEGLVVRCLDDYQAENAHQDDD